ncbi:predicted protein [Plenodomus lingam JN3]|uniref:Predicted protein n=1 Tax=Leptosphaeria maculans (strain JN3 / isolate v23.1.3 / race Av1-4-5-6-7-8) TaxID=985895 RepID=E5AFS0_LEPMJ|nr:predicted protein [Plenodomus lingam JN3]CBY02059.1 predicted protein [Plenodomus lingam JN3]
MYAGCAGYAPVERMWEQLGRAELERLLWRDVLVYDGLAGKVGEWKRGMDGRMGRCDG